VVCSSDLGRGGPGAGDALVAVDDEVDRQQPPLAIPLAHRVGTDLRPLVLARELQLYVVVGVVTELEPVDAVAGEDDPGAGRSQCLDRLDRRSEQRSIASAILFSFQGDTPHDTESPHPADAFALV